MSIPSHGLCDQCEKKMVPLDGMVTEDALLAAGWIVVTWLEVESVDDDGLVEAVDVNKDFCSMKCAAHWFVDESDGSHARAGEGVGEA